MAESQDRQELQERERQDRQNREWQERERQEQELQDREQQDQQDWQDRQDRQDRQARAPEEPRVDERECPACGAGKLCTHCGSPAWLQFEQPCSEFLWGFGSKPCGLEVGAVLRREIAAAASPGN